MSGTDALLEQLVDSEKLILRSVFYSPDRDENKVNEAFQKVLLIHWNRIQEVLHKGANAKAYQTRNCLNALIVLANLRYTLNDEFPLNYGHPFLDAILMKIETLCQAIKKRVFQSISETQTFFDGYELDEMFLDVNALICIGKYVPWIDLQCLSPFGDIVCEIMGYYSEYIAERLADIESRKITTLETALVKKDMFDNIRISAFRFRTLCNHILDHICLQKGFNIHSTTALEALVQYAESKNLIPCQRESDPFTLFFVTGRLMKNHALFTRFYQSGVNTSSCLSGELIIIASHETIVPQFLEAHPEFQVKVAPATSPLNSYVVTTLPCSSLIIAKSLMALRTTTVDLHSIHGLQSVELKKALDGVCPTRHHQVDNDSPILTFICLRDLINDKLSELCLHITRVLTIVTYEDKRILDTVGLADDQDRSIAVAISYTVQVLLESSSTSEAFQDVFVKLVECGHQWVNFQIQQYVRGIDVDWAVFYLVKILESLNSLYAQTDFVFPESWKQYYVSFATSVQQMEELCPKRTNSSSHSYILDQAHLFLSLIHVENVATKVPLTQLRYPYQRTLEGKNYYIFGLLGHPPNIVYKCLDLISRRMVVIKKIELADEKCMELEYLKTLNHPNIVRYIKSFVESSVLFFVMEHCEDTIEFSAQRVTGEIGLNEEEIKFIGRQVLRGLSYLHSNHIVHRDIKPSNILKTGSGFIKIADFGDAQFITANEPSEKFDMGSLFGTPHFMAPECLHRAQVGPSADIWSFGCVLVYLISGKLPWQNCDNRFNVLFKLGSFKELPVDVDTLNCSSASKAVLRSIFQINPADRPTAVDLLRTDYFSRAIDSLI